MSKPLICPGNFVLLGRDTLVWAPEHRYIRPIFVLAPMFVVAAPSQDHLILLYDGNLLETRTVDPTTVVLWS